MDGPVEELCGGMSRHWHALAVEETLAAVGSDAACGLTPEEARRRLAEVGPNALPEPGRRSLLWVFVRQFRSPLIYLLFLAAAIALVLGERSDAAVIAVVVLLNAVIGAVQEGRAERSLEALRRSTAQQARVLRAGKEETILARDVVPGDILLLAAGDAVSADARLIDGRALQIAEAALTGESVPVAKDARPLAGNTAVADRRNMVYAGTHVTAGRARAVVVATGPATEIGRIAAMTEAAIEPPTPLERRIEQFGRYIIVAAAVMFVIVVAAGVLRGIPAAEIFMIAVSQLVGMIPEGLPVAMTIALAAGVQRMARRRAVVRRLSAVETLGATTVICSDKTGTLTRNEMTVTAICLADGREIAVSGSGYVPQGSFSLDGRTVQIENEPALRSLLEAAVLCNDAQLFGPDETDSSWKPFGDPTEVALLTAAIKAGIVPPEVRARQPRRAELPFDAATKMMATQHDSPGGPLVVIKGAPESVLELCAGDPRQRARMQEQAAAMAARALRVLAIAAAPGAEIDGRAGFAALRGRAHPLGLIGQIDPPREEVAEAIARCRSAGIRPVMITGDHLQTAVAIARQLGIAGARDTAIDGDTLEEIDDAELAARIERIAVFARVHPAQKLRIVEAYRRRGEVVAVTGDGVNDAPALARANVGVAMGITGTEVAKDAAKIVVTDDNFATIVAAVEEGRVVYRNIKRAILLLFSTSVAEVAILLLALLLGYPPPFAAVQILWNNLVTEGVIIVNLIMEPAEGDEMQRPPISPREPLLTRLLLVRVAVMVPAIVLSTLGWFAWRTAAGVPAAHVQTEAFTLLALCEWFNVLNCRSERGSALNLSILRNPWLVGGLIAGNILQAAVVFWAPLGRVFHTVPFTLGDGIALGAAGSLVLWAEEVRKLVDRRRHRLPSCAASRAES